MLKKIQLLLLMFFCCLMVFGQQETDSLAVQNLYNKILTLDDKIRNDPALQVNNFNPNDSASLPIGIVKEIGNNVYIICIDSARFTPQGAFFSVYMALDFPDSDKKIAFAAKNVQFNPQGVIVSNGSRLQLVSRQEVKLGPKMKMVFKDNGKNFIEWDCNGYKQTGVSIDFVFDQGLFENAISPQLPVTAAMELVVQDLNNISFQLNDITPFKIKGAKDFVFHLQNVVIDRSEFITPVGVVLSPQALATYNGNIESWKGFYAQNAEVTLPDKLSGKNGQTQVYANNLVIDDSGLSGSFGGNNLFSTSEGKMNGKWGFSLKNIQVDVANNHITGGALAGEIIVPALNNTSFEYAASITENPEADRPDYHFTISPNEEINMSAFKSTIKLYPSSQLRVQSVQNRFVPSALLNGSWTVDFGKANVKGLSFQNLSIVTDAPYINSGTFSLAGSSDNNLIGLPVSINSVGLHLTPQNELSFAVGVAMNLGGQQGSNQPIFGVNTTLRIDTKRATHNSGSEEIAFDRFHVDDIGVNLNTSVFGLEGVISLRSDDPVFGDLFYGSIALEIKKMMNAPIMVSAGFGKMSDYKYWFTDASLPVNIPIVGGINITSLYGGVQNRVASTLTQNQLIDRVIGNVSTQPNNGALIPFVPDQSQGLLFRAGVGLANTKEEVFNGEAVLSIAFNPNGGFENINFSGQAYMMVTREDRLKPNVKKVWGNLGVNYDNSQKVFDAGINAAIIVPNTLNGAINLDIHVDSTDWYFWLNRPSYRAYLNLANVFNINSYFMIGTIIDPIPPPPGYITNLVGAGSISNIDLAAVGNGNGFATGVQFGVNINEEFPKNTQWRGYVDLNVGGGFDLMMVNVQNATCTGSSDPVGVNGYYCMGQVYAYLDGSLGARRYRDNGDINHFPLGSLQMATLLQGKLPNPTFVYGAVGVQANVLGIINFGFTADVEFGTDCQLTGM